jgi:alkylated DNA repair dioxygenase AlkB
MDKNITLSTINLFAGEETLFDDGVSATVYHPEFLTTLESVSLFQYLLDNLAWTNDTARIYGQTIITKRKIVWYSDYNLNYNYSGANRVGDGQWDPEVYKIKQYLEAQTKQTYNSCLLNLYHNGQEGMSWHSDDQNHLIPNTPVAIISLGVSRYFKLRLNSDRKHTIHKILLEQGSLITMSGQTQLYWQHEIPKMLSVKDIRISLTFRSMR